MSFVEFRNLMIYKIGSPKIFVYLIIWLMVLVFFGTIAQKDYGLYLVQMDYFLVGLNGLDHSQHRVQN